MIEVEELESVAALIAVRFSRLATEKSELVASGASAEEIIRHDSIVAALMDAQKLLLARSTEMRAEEERAAKYAIAYPLACELKEKVEAAFNAHERASAEYQTAEKNVSIIDLAIADHVSSKPKAQNFPSPQVSRKWVIRLRHLEELRDERKATLCERVKELDEARVEWSRLKLAFDQAAFQARYYQPRQKATAPVPIAWAMPSAVPSRVVSL